MIWSRKLLALLLGSVAASTISTHAAPGPEQTVPPIQRLHAIRAAYLASLHTAARAGDGEVGHTATAVPGDAAAAVPGKAADDGKDADAKLAQWGNFPNFPNFPNWNNWNNWFNGWMNY